MLPPAVGGIALLVTFGRLGLLHGFGGIAFTQAAVVVAICFVAGPFYVRPAIAAFEAVDQAQLDAARTLGAGPARVFGRIALPLAVGGLGAGAALSFARGLGEFGATIMFAGSLQGVTQTLPLAIYAEFDRNLDVAIALGALLVVFSAAILLARQADPPMDALRLDLTLPRRAFELELALELGRGDGRARRPLGRRQDERAARRRGPRAGRAGHDRVRRRGLARAGSRAPARRSARWGCSSRTTRSSRT